MPLVNTVEKRSKRIFGLDILRAVAILMVVAYHSTPLLVTLTRNKNFGRVIVYTVRLLEWLGPISVSLFFVLSGFLIGTILIRLFSQTQKYKIHIIWEFWIKRWFRTLPNYFFLLTVAFIVYKIMYNQAFDWRYYLFIQNFNHPMPLFFGETWSLSIEEWTYLLLPVAILLMARLFSKTDKKDILKYALILYILVAIGIRFYKISQQNYHDIDTEIRKVTIFRLDAIIYGVIGAYLMVYYESTLAKLKNVLLFMGSIGLLVTLVLFYWSLHHPGIYRPGGFYKIILDTLCFCLVPVFFALMVPAAYFLQDVRQSTWKRMVTHISLISYSLYLIHNALIFIPFFQPLRNNPSDALIIFYYLLFWVVIISLSSVNYHYFEKPTTRLRNAFLSPKDKKILEV